MALRFILSVLPVMMVCVILVACDKPGIKPEKLRGKEFNFNSLAKSDIGVVMEIHVNEVRHYLRSLMQKLYRRNPRELKKSLYPTADQNIDRLFAQKHNWDFAELEGRKGIQAVRLTFTDGYTGDRVFAFIAGLSYMIMSSYGYKTEFFLFDTVDPQNLYNCARNIEIAVWKLEHDHDENNELYLYSNSLSGEVANLSYERLFGKLIALQDTMAIIVAGRTGRTVKKIIQRMATAVFLPVF